MSLQHRALELERQRGHRRFGGAEAFARLRPLAEPGIGQRPPQRRVMLVADERIRQVLQGRVGPADHDIGDGAQHHRRRVLGRRRIVGDRDVEHRLRLGIHVAGEVEAREIAARRRAASAPARRRRPASAAILRSVKSAWRSKPQACEIEHVALVQRLRAGLSPSPRAKARRAARSRPCRPTISAREIVGQRLQGDAVGGRQRAELDEILRLEEAARRRGRRDHVAAVSPTSGSSMRCRLRGFVDRDRDAGARRRRRCCG